MILISLVPRNKKSLLIPSDQKKKTQFLLVEREAINTPENGLQVLIVLGKFAVEVYVRQLPVIVVNWAVSGF